MEHMIQLHIEKPPEGAYLATSDDMQGSIAQGRTIQETIEIARDVAQKLIEAQTGAPLPATAVCARVGWNGFVTAVRTKEVIGNGARYRCLTL